MVTNGTVITVLYRKEDVSERTTQKIFKILDTAITYLLGMCEWKLAKPGFKSAGCARKSLSMASWHKILILSDVHRFSSSVEPLSWDRRRRGLRPRRLFCSMRLRRRSGRLCLTGTPVQMMSRSVLLLNINDGHIFHLPQKYAQTA